MKKHEHRGKLLKDFSLFILGVIFAAILVRVGVLSDFLTATQGVLWLESFIAGIFFTSSFSVAIATVALLDIAHHAPALEVAFCGAIGSMIGDVIIFLFIRNVVTEDATRVIKKSKYKETLSFMHLGLVRLLSLLLGALIIASPLPDELGLGIMGLTKMKAWYVLPIAFAMNFLGILAVIAVANILIVPV
jgi:hypothetical protein